MTLATEVADKETMGAGTAIQFEIESSFQTLPEVESIPQIGGNKEFEENTRIDNSERKYIKKLEVPQEIELSFDDLPNDTVQKAVIAAAEAESTLKAKVIYSNGRVATFDLEFRDHYAAQPEIDKPVMHAVMGIARTIEWSLIA
jgi:hypothetical protein